MTLTDDIPSIEAIFTAYIIRANWGSHGKGVPHEFLLLQVERPGSKTLWRSIDKRPHRDVTAAEFASPTLQWADTVRMLYHFMATDPTNGVFSSRTW